MYGRCYMKPDGLTISAWIRRLARENAALKAERDARKDKQCFHCGRSPASSMDD